MQSSIRQKAVSALECFLGPGKSFRKGQCEVIKITLTNKDARCATYWLGKIIVGERVKAYFLDKHIAYAANSQ